MRSGQTRDDNTKTSMPATNSLSYAYRARDAKPESALATTVALEKHGIVAINRKRSERTSSNNFGVAYSRFQLFAAVRADLDPSSTPVLVTFVAARSRVGLVWLLDHA